MTMYIFQKIAQTNEVIRERNLCLWREVHARKAGESVPLLRVITPYPAPGAMRSNEARKGKTNIRKGNPKNVVELNLPLQRPVVFV